jgi:ribose 5-phosphate isomerase RpiB
MKIALIIENSQAAKNGIVHEALTSVAVPLGHQVFNYGMYSPEDTASLTYVMNGLLTGILLNSGAADFVVTGCGTGMGSMLAANSMPGVFCGLVIDPTDAFLFSQINDGNAISMPYGRPNSICRIAIARFSKMKVAQVIPKSVRTSWLPIAAS